MAYRLVEGKTLPCRICSESTSMRGTQLCDRCYELERKITAAPELARKILAGLDPALNATKSGRVSGQVWHASNTPQSR